MTWSPNWHFDTATFRILSAHEYKYDAEKGKPLSAFEFAKKMPRKDTVPIYKFARQILGFIEKDCEFTIGDIERLVPDEMANSD